jgi:hypothetical protein
MDIIPDPEAAGISQVKWSGVDPFTIEDDKILQELNRQALEELKLGGALSAQEERGAQQAARGAFAARGMAFSNPAMVAEVLKRDELARARQAERRAFASSVEGLNQPIDLANLQEVNASRRADAQGELAADIASNESARSVFATLTGARVDIAQGNQQTGLTAATANQRAALEQQGMSDAWFLGQDRLRSDTNQAGLSAAVQTRGQNVGMATSIYGTQAGIYEAQLRAEAERLQAMRGGGNQADLVAGGMQQAGIRAAANAAVPARYQQIGAPRVPDSSYRPIGYY